MEVGPIGELTAREVEALRGAAVWYAKYHSSRVSERVGDRAASAVAEREEYSDLLAALRKLGVPAYARWVGGDRIARCVRAGDVC